MNIYLQELRAYRKNTILWIVSLGVATAAFVAMYAVFTVDAEAMVELMKGFPDIVLKAFGMLPETMISINGFYSFVLGFLVLCGAIQAMSLGISVLAKETTGKTADFLLTKPVTRVQVLTAKLLAVLTHLAASSACFMLVATVTAFSVDTRGFDYSAFMLMSLTFFWVQLIFAALGFVTAAVVPKIRSVLPVSLSAVFAFYIVGMAGAALEDDKLYYLSPFKYFDPVHIAQYSSYELSYAMVAMAVVIAAVAAGYVIFTRRDVHAA